MIGFLIKVLRTVSSVRSIISPLEGEGQPPGGDEKVPHRMVEVPGSGVHRVGHKGMGVVRQAGIFRAQGAVGGRGWEAHAHLQPVPGRSPPAEEDPGEARQDVYTVLTWGKVRFLSRELWTWAQRKGEFCHSVTLVLPSSAHESPDGYPGRDSECGAPRILC